MKSFFEGSETQVASYLRPRPMSEKGPERKDEGKEAKDREKKHQSETDLFLLSDLSFVSTFRLESR